MKIFIVSIISAIILAGCSENVYKKITSDSDRNVNFNNYKTYAWLNDHLPHTPTPYDNEIIENNIKNYVDQDLALRNFTPKMDKPDLLFELVLTNREKVQTSTQPIFTEPYSTYPFNSYRYYNPESYRWNPNGFNNFGYVRPAYQIGNRLMRTTYDRSTITINAIDRATNKLVWTGSAKGDIYDERYIKSDIHPAVINILKQYPIKPIKK